MRDATVVFLRKTKYGMKTQLLWPRHDNYESKIKDELNQSSIHVSENVTEMGNETARSRSSEIFYLKFQRVGYIRKFRRKHCFSVWGRLGVPPSYLYKETF